MSDFDLPAISTDAHPDFTDATSCAAWLAELPLINVAPSQIRLLDQVQELNRFDMPPAERLKVLEALREATYFVQAEQIKKLANKPLPLTQVERGIFGHVVELWQELLTGYLRGLKDVGEGRLQGQRALICQRALDSVASNMFAHCRVYHAFPGSYWQALHRLYCQAEEAKENVTGVYDPLKKIDVSCSEVYVRALLLVLANPNEQLQKQLLQIESWLDQWAQHVPVRRKPPEDKTLPPLLLDFSAAAGAYREADATGRSTAAWLDLGELAQALKRLVVLLRKGESPASLGLGEDCSMPGTEQLLVLLFRLWCEGKTERVPSRHSVSEKALVCSSLASMHFHISGKVFSQPGHATRLSKSQSDEIATYGHISARRDEADARSHGEALEEWQLRDESLSGLRIERPATVGGARYSHTQLLAVRPADAKSFLLGVVRWLRTDKDHNLQAGIRIVPGVPRAVAARPTGINAQSEKFVPALYCPAVVALASPASLILPPGWYRPKRVLEIYGDSSESLLLTGVVERGSDFERVAVEPAR
ncbi:MAG: hypothetical protein ABIH03_02670 [Pseudomonadota bacterium]